MKQLISNKKISLLVAFAALLGGLVLSCSDPKNIPEKECQVLGTQQCGCLSNGMCSLNDDGIQLVCIDDICELPSCRDDNALSVGCLCGGDKMCDEGNLCLNGHCVKDSGQSVAPPENPTCYTPCQGGYYRESDGSYVECDKDGLLEGCIGDAECINGTCVASSKIRDCDADDCSDDEAETMGYCESDDECPIFQVCIGFQCYSDCSSDDDCRSGRQCYRKSCRVPCVNDDDASSDECPTGTFCSTSDGTSGYCLPIDRTEGDDVNTEEQAQKAVVIEAEFEYLEDSLSFNSRTVSGSIHMVNNTPVDREITVKKASHVEYDNGVATTVDTYPLHWLTLSFHQDPLEQVQSLTTVVPANGGEVVLNVGDVVNGTLKRWDGKLEILADGHPTKELSLYYTGSAEGHWAGRTYYFSNFGTQSLDGWVGDRDNRDRLKVVGNAFIRKWGAFRQKRISWDEFLAVLTATQTESWRWSSVQSKCPNEDSPNSNAACYLYDNALGIAMYSDYTPDNPVPSGVTDFAMSMNVRADAPEASPGVWSGKVISSDALQYGGDPSVSLVFNTNPNVCQSDSGVPCITFIDSFNIDMVVGGRYLADPNDVDCENVPSGTFDHGQTPWLVPGFEAYTSEDSSGRRYIHECRDTILPLGIESKYKDTNWSLSAANPIPDGATRHRNIELVDGALIDQQYLFIIFKESFPSFLDPNDAEGFEAYGYMLLEQSPSNLGDSDFKGNEVDDIRVPPSIEGVECDDELFDEVGIYPFDADGDVVDNHDLSRFAIALIDGLVVSDNMPEPLGDYSAEKVHYYCEDTNLFDGGPLDDGYGGSEKVPCPNGSRVTFFTLTGTGSSQAEVAAHPCQEADCGAEADCGCQDTLNTWVENGYADIRLDPVWMCDDEDEVFCSYDRSDLRSGKKFYPADESAAVFSSIDEQVNEAFRYKTKFTSDSGGKVGFAPDVCIADSNQVPYCYDPPSIEAIQQRVDCASKIYAENYDQLETVLGKDAKAILKEYLQRNYAYAEEHVDGLSMPVIHEGFEDLFAELLVMQGDESYTAAFASRFDLAQQNIASFEGALFEPDGMDLAGGAGFEMYRLYQAVQYYQMALNRFYKLAPLIWTSIGELPDGQGFVTPETVVTWFERLVNASSKKSAAWSEISKRYHNFNRPELARLVIERAYTAAHLESIVLGRLMLRLVTIPNSSNAEQIEYQLRQAAQRNRSALLDMKKAYDDISDDVTYFGFQPDYIPFPALYPLDSNAFVKSMARAEQRLAVAKEKETRALEDNRQFETSSELFQAELARITNEYEAQLGQVCGTFTVAGPEGDISVYPAIPTYAELDERAALMGDPCGMMGNGDLNDALINLQAQKKNLDDIKLARDNVFAEMEDAQNQVIDQCERIQSLADFRMTMDDANITLQTYVAHTQAAISTLDRLMGMAGVLSGLTKCSAGTSTDCPTAAVSLGVYVGTASVITGAAAGLEQGIAAAQVQMAKNESLIVQRDILEQCTAAEIDVQYTLRALARRLKEIEMEALKAALQIKLAVSDIQRKRNEALRILEDMNQTLELMINTEAARNDPNVRVYRNDAIINADKTFFDAMQQAYRVTKIYEYYTSSSYPEMENLHLIRMVSYGTYNLERYLADLNEAFLQFEEDYGLADDRVALISLKDDILGIPTLDGDGVALSSSKRTEMLHERLADVDLLDENGYIVMPFSTDFEQVSPLTTTHKVNYIQAEIIGSNVGDAIGRIYVRQKGTGVVRDLEGGKLFYAFPTRTAVVDTFFNGLKFFDPEVYHNERLRDRPYVNTEWELVFNQKDEAANMDVVLDSLTDIRLYVYYTDFTGE